MYNTIGYGYANGEEDVKKLQTKLNENGAQLETDGKFGPQTYNAIKTYQQENGLTVDGVAGKETFGKLYGSASSDMSASPLPSGGANNVNQTSVNTAESTSSNSGKNNNPTVDALISEIRNRKPFQYNINEDALYQQLADQYIAQGKMAMMDTMGQAASLTGGYGSSFAQSVGHQAYQDQLQGLNEQIPDLYQMAINKYQMEGDALYDQAALTMQQEENRRADEHWQAEFNASEDQRQKDNAYREEESKKPDLGVEKTKRLQAILDVDQTGLWDAATEEAAQALYGTSDPDKVYELWHNKASNTLNAQLGGTDDENFKKVLSNMDANHVPWRIMAQVLNPQHFQESELSEEYGSYRLYLYDMLAYAYDQIK